MVTKKPAAKTKSSPANAVVETLNARLADLVDLHWQIKQAHWNVTGMDFIAVHHLFDEQAAMAREMADTLAERARGLEGVAEGTIRLAVERSTMDEFPHGLIEAKRAISELVDRYEQLSEAFKNASNEAADAEDKGTEDVYVELIRQIDKQAYFLRAHLK
ncbi:MAG: DNA starvation/stationary phase protection protein Dps [Chloroflexi bacterium]|nr:DNA starvation/stationary phase protection protein Dps [Chloroflexota bacterium]